MQQSFPFRLWSNPRRPQAAGPASSHCAVAVAGYGASRPEKPFFNYAMNGARFESKTRRQRTHTTTRAGDLLAGNTVMVDTAPFIHVLEAHPEFADRFAGVLEAADAGHVQLALSSITLAEVLTGPFKAGQTALAKRYEKALMHYTVVPVSAQIAALAAQLRAQYRCRLPDAIPLATAIDVGASTFVTHDRDFLQVTGITVPTGE